MDKMALYRKWHAQLNLWRNLRDQALLEGDRVFFEQARRSVECLMERIEGLLPLSTDL